MNLENWLKENNPGDGPRWYTFDYEKFKKDEDAEYKDISKQIGDIIAEEFNNVCKESGHDMVEFTNNIMGGGTNHKYIIDNTFLRKMILKIQGRLEKR